jgi:hypothetical protein
MDTCAVAALCGVPVARILDGDPIECAVWVRVTERAAELRVQMMQAEANYVGHAVARAFGGR